MRAPGIYFEAADLGPEPVSVRTDVAGIIGFAAQGPVGEPVALDSYTQFETVFGKPRPDLHLGWAVRGFFENGGQRAWVCRAASGDAASSSADLSDSNGPAFRIRAASEGVWGDLIEVSVSENIRVEARSTEPVIEGRGVGVADTSEMRRGDLLRLRQAGGFSTLCVVNRVDHATSRVFWAASDPANALDSDVRITGFDPAQPIMVARLRYTLLVSIAGVVRARYSELGIVPGGPNYIADMVNGLPGPIAVEGLLSNGTQVAELILPTGALTLGGGQDGLATVTPDDLKSALHAFDLIPEPAIFLIPDLHEADPPLVRTPLPVPEPDPCLDCPPPEPQPARTPEVSFETPPGFSHDQIARLQHVLLDWCAVRPNSFAVLDLPRALASDAGFAQRLLAWRQRFNSAFGALYYPWVNVPRSDASAFTRPTPAAGHVAGQMAARDLADGVHHAPANLPLRWAQGTTADTHPPLHALLNEDNLNVIRTTTGRGMRIMGARTLSNDVDWRFVPVRRLVSMIAHALSLSSRWAIFEPNTHATRAKLAAVYASYLTAIWRRGGLAGASPDEAFFVNAERAEDEALTGRLTMTVGVAPLNPMEFIIFRIGREDGAVSVETSGAGRFQGAA